MDVGSCDSIGHKLSQDRESARGLVTTEFYTSDYVMCHDLKGFQECNVSIYDLLIATAPLLCQAIGQI